MAAYVQGDMLLNDELERTMDGKVFLLTGAPGVGKSTLRKNLEKAVSNLKCFDYGSLLLQAKERQQKELSYEEMRQKSSHVIAHSDVIDVDKELIDSVSVASRQFHCLIDSHAVTRENYGYRAVPFSPEQLRELRFDAIIVLHASPHVLSERVNKEPKGRQLIDSYIAAQHQYLQDAVAINYAVLCHCRYYGIDADKDEASVLEMALNLFRKEGVS
jgi:adenylate kinase